MKGKWIAAMSIAALGTGLALSAGAAQDDNGWFQKEIAGIVIRHVERELALTDAQRDQIKTILKTEQPNIESLAARAHEAQKELHSAQGFDEASVRNFARQNEATTEDILVEREKVRSEILAVLTPEQRQKAELMREQSYRRFMQRLNTIGDQL
ncbi:MAG TPA: Spy/CpxP family protein refolding chaperone [Terracidiphilus sp.]|nr:Spy/CpxP family protein refolding chaperone [Terracidiphilus sp.]